ncbi:MAG: hypothetical protein ACLFUO_01545 [Candidatus Woesearchaeota archaeon]
MDFNGPAGNASLGASVNSGGSVPGDPLRPFRRFFSSFARIFGFGMRIAFIIAIILGIIWLITQVGPWLLVKLGIAAQEAGIDSGEDAINRAWEAKDDFLKNTEGEWEKQMAFATGQSYESEVDANSGTDLGVRILEIDHDASYKYDEAVTVWARVHVGSLGDGYTNVISECYLQDPNDKDKKIYGATNPDSFSVYREEDVDIRCTFEPGALQKERNKMVFSLKYNFSTKAYLKTSFMQGTTMRNLMTTNPEIFDEYGADPIAKNSDGPISIGMGASSYPVPIGNLEVLPTLGFTITDRGEGKIERINYFEVMIPQSLSINCDSNKQLEEINAENGLKTYRMSVAGLQNMNDNIESDVNTYKAENIKCQIDSPNPRMLFSGFSYFTPVKRSVFADINYTYIVEESEYLVVNENEGFVVSFKAGNDYGNKITRAAEVECIGNYYDGQIESATYQISLHKTDPETGKLEKMMEYGPRNAVMTDSSAKRVSSQMIFFNSPEVFDGNMEKGDTVLCTMKIRTKYGGEEMTSSRYALVENSLPEIDSLSLYPSTPDPFDNIVCRGLVDDKDTEDEITASYTIKVNGETVKNGIIPCIAYQSSDTVHLCDVVIESSLTELNDYVHCTMLPNDGRFSGTAGSEGTSIEEESSGDNVIANSSSVDQPQEDPDTQNPNEETETLECEDEDGGKEYSYKSTTTGLDESGEPVSMTDYCESDSSLIEYYCEDNIVKYTSIPCSNNCYDGEC